MLKIKQLRNERESHAQEMRNLMDEHKGAAWTPTINACLLPRGTVQPGGSRRHPRQPLPSRAVGRYV